MNILLSSRHQKIFSWLLAFFLITALLLPANQHPVSASNAPLTSNREKMLCLNNGQAITSVHPITGETNFIGTEAGQSIANPVALPADASPEQAARAYLSVCGSLFGIKDSYNELMLKREKATEIGGSAVRFQQTYQGIPILGGEITVTLNAQKNILSVSGETLPKIAVDTTPQIEAATAQQEALALVAKYHQVNMDDLQASQPELWIYNPALISPFSGATELVWRMEVTARQLAPIRELVLINAQRGNVSLHFNQVDTALNRLTYTANHSTTLPGTLVCDESNPTCTSGDLAAKNAHKFAGQTYNFYYTRHGRDSIDNAGMTLISTTHYNNNFCNAFWNGSQMVYGDGCFLVTDDVVAHELTHGVTEYESGLFYWYQSGAINESFSDTWGEFMDLTNATGNDSPAVRWKMGEDTSIGAIRDMKNPPAKGDPDKMTSPNYYKGSADNGGVHTNSGVNNKAVYLMTDGGTFNGKTIVGLGITKVAKIYYYAQTNLLTSGADYLDLYNALYQACNSLVGTAGITQANCTQVRNATLAVEMNKQPVAGFNTDAPVCPAGKAAVNLFFDNLESGSANWTMGALVGTNRWSYDSPYGPFAHSGVHELYADDYPAAITDSFVALTSDIAIPSGVDVYLRFDHAYGFEYGTSYYDGGVLEYSTDGGSTWNDAGSLLDWNGYDGTLSTLYSNPLGGRSAFAGESHGYISSRANLTSLAGQNVRFRWRMGLDSSTFNMGWWLDDVRVYKCVPIQSATFTSSGAEDGYIQESSETSNIGGTMASVGTTLAVGDASADRQVLAVLSFDTSSLPDTAVITSAIIKVKQAAIVGTNPFSTHGNLLVDLSNPYFGSLSTLEISDFEAAATIPAAATFGSTPLSGWYSAKVKALAFSSINLTGTTQFRLRFTKDDNDDLAADQIKFYSGDAATNKPVLIIKYYVP